MQSMHQTSTHTEWHTHTATHTHTYRTHEQLSVTLNANMGPGGSIRSPSLQLTTQNELLQVARSCLGLPQRSPPIMESRRTYEK